MRRCRTNSSYSLRAFARSLKIEPSALSQIINKKRPLTEKMKLRLGSALGLGVRELELMLSSDSLLKTRNSRFQQMSLDTFALISDWYHYAIIEATYLSDFKPCAKWISCKLGITKSEANIAVERLFRLGLIEKTTEGLWKDATENGELTHITPGLSSVGARQYQAQILELSKKAIQEVELDERNHTSATLCFDIDDFPKAVQKIAEFRRKFAKELQPKKKAKSVYQIQISFFPLTRSMNEE